MPRVCLKRFNWRLALLFFALLWGSISAISTQPITKASLISNYKNISPQTQEIELGIQLELPEGWHTYSDPAGQVGSPPKFEWDLPKNIKISAPQFAPAKKIVADGLVSYGYEKTTTFRFKLNSEKPFKLGEKLQLKVKAKWLVCKDICKPEQADLELTLPIESSTSLSGQLSPEKIHFKLKTLAILFFAFLGGVILNVMPCVLPVLSLKFLSLSKLTSKKEKRLNTLGYTLGILLTFWAIALIIIILKTQGTYLGWGFQLQSPLFVAALCILFTLIALNLFGVFEVGLSLTRLNTKTPQTSFLSALVTGIISTLVATPCAAPFLGTTIGLALASTSIAWTFTLFTTVALGLAAPFILLLFLPNHTQRLPKPGPWMITLKQFLGFPMLLSSWWLLSIFETQTSPATSHMLNAALILTALVAWIYGKNQVKWPKASQIFIGLTLLGMAFFLNQIIAPPPLKTSIPWEPYSQQKLATALTQNQIVFIDFTADWCLTCQVNDRLVFQSEEIKTLFKTNKIVALKADWTHQNPEITAAMKSYKRSAVPLYVLYSGKNPPQILPELLTISKLKNAISPRQTSQNTLK